MSAVTYTTKQINDFAVKLIKEQGLNFHQIESYNHFIHVGIKQIIEELFQLENTIELNNKHNDNVNRITYKLTFENIRTKKPGNALSTIMVVPSFSRKNDLSYSIEVIFDIICNFTIFLVNGTIDKLEKKVLNKSFELPCMIKSEGCNLWGMNNDMLVKAGEDPCDIGGYFVQVGKEWIINMLESKVFNSPHIYDTTGHENELTRLEIINKPGDGYAHSSEIIIKILRNGNIVTILNSHNYLKNIPLPFYIIYKLLEVFIDKNIIEYITSFTNDEVLKSKIIYVLNLGFLADNPIFNKTKNIIYIDELIKTVAECIGNPEHVDILDSKMIKYIETFEKSILNILDSLFFPNIGKTSEDRSQKIYYYSYLLYRVILVNLKIAPQTDRDHLSNKRIYTPGQLLSKELKSVFTVTIVRPISMRIDDEINKNSIYTIASLVVILNSLIKFAKLTSTITKALTTGQKDLKISNTIITQNKIPSEQLIRKNNLNVIAAQRTIRAPTIGASKTSGRAHDMRQVKSIYTGNICSIQSADSGEKVGIVKQLALGAIVSLSAKSEELEQVILRDKFIVLPTDVNLLTIEKYGFAKIFLNGKFIALTLTPFEFVTRFREYRRGFDFDFTNNTFIQLKVHKINKYTSIYWDFFHNNIYFWLDHGRILKPLFIVRSNFVKYEHSSIIKLYFKDTYTELKTEKNIFEQKILLDNTTYNYSLKELLQNGIMEYISPDEIDNMLLAIDINTLYENKNNILLTYTHCDIPCINYSLAASSCPFPGNNQMPRLTFQTNQIKQATGNSSLNLLHRIDKHTYYSVSIQMPLVKTIYNDILYPNGSNILLAIMSYKDNQEDSLIADGTAIERTLYDIVEYDYIKVILEQNEYCGIKNMSTIRANYKKLDTNFCVSKNTHIVPNDVLLAKYTIINKDDFKNTSYVYRGTYEIVVEDIITGKTVEGYDYYKFKYYIMRRCTVGDKFSTRHGQKGSVSSVLPYYLLPFTTNCLNPSTIMNSFALPSRMTIGQIIEGHAAKIAALTGKYVDATIFEPTNIDESRRILKENGMNEWCNEEFIDGLYGHPINKRIFMSPIFIQRLQKFATAEQQATSIGSSSLITHQPLDGKANNGGLRFGEMEKDVCTASGQIHFCLEKLRENSDGCYIYICRKCHKIATVNSERKIFKCNFCQGPDIVKIYSEWMVNVLIHHLESCCIGVKLYPEEYCM